MENVRALGGMRRPHLAVRRLPRARAVGRRLRAALEAALAEEPGYPEGSPVASLLRGEVPQSFGPELVDRARRHLAACLFEDPEAQLRGAPAPGEGVWPALVGAQVRAAGDPDGFLEEWLAHGAPTGILEEIPLAGAFPRTEPRDDRRDPGSLASATADCSNYTSAEEAPEVVWGLIYDAEAKGFCEVFASAAEAEAKVGGPLVLTKLGLITKVRQDGTLKHRVVWDMRANDLNATIQILERIVLPRLEDAVDDIRELAALLCTGELLLLMVLDVQDAFHQVPLWPSERRWHAAMLDGHVVVFSRLVFGSKSSPGVWGRVSAWAGRSTAALLPEDRALTELYVDDPLFVARGDVASAAHELTVAALWLS